MIWKGSQMLMVLHRSTGMQSQPTSSWWMEVLYLGHRRNKNLSPYLWQNQNTSLPSMLPKRHFGLDNLSVKCSCLLWNHSHFIVTHNPPSHSPRKAGIMLTQSILIPGIILFDISSKKDLFNSFTALLKIWQPTHSPKPSQASRLNILPQLLAFAQLEGGVLEYSAWVKGEAQQCCGQRLDCVGPQWLDTMTNHPRYPSSVVFALRILLYVLLPSFDPIVYYEQLVLQYKYCCM